MLSEFSRNNKNKKKNNDNSQKLQKWANSFDVLKYIKIK